jgi:hypothetical protein
MEDFNLIYFVLNTCTEKYRVDLKSSNEVKVKQKFFEITHWSNVQNVT